MYANFQVNQETAISIQKIKLQLMELGINNISNKEIFISIIDTFTENMENSLFEKLHQKFEQKNVKSKGNKKTETSDLQESIIR